MKILLMGNPNVGKSVVFSRLTGVHVVASNYPGTTVEYAKGSLKLQDGEQAELIDVPGTYSLDATCEAEAVAVDMVAKGDIIINVVDATNLERNLFLTLKILSLKKPTIVALNMWDDAKHRGINIEVAALAEMLGVPVVPTVAVTGEGIKELVGRLNEARISAKPLAEGDDLWSRVGEIIFKVQEVVHRHHTILESIEDASISPFYGLLIFATVIAASFSIVRFIGEGLINYVLEPLFISLYLPLVMRLSLLLGSSGFIHEIIIGKLINGSIDLDSSYGLLTTAPYVSIVLVMPYIFSFYLVLGFLEDLGYLPRIAVLMDNLMHKLGLHGAAIIPMILGLGCSVPGALSTRVLESRREKFIATTMLATSVPCMSQTAMIVGLVARFGLNYLILVFMTLFLVWLSMGLILNATVKGESPEIFLEIPHYRLPNLAALTKKLWMRFRGYIVEAVPLVMLGVFIINLLYMVGLIGLISRFTTPIVTNLWGLPKEAVPSLVIGFLRKDLAVGMLRPLGLTAKQAVIGSSILAIYFPCMAMLMVMIKELGMESTFRAALIMGATALFVGTILNLIL